MKGHGTRTLMKLQAKRVVSQKDSIRACLSSSSSLCTACQRMGKALLDWRLLGAGLLREAPRQARLCLESAANQKPSRQPRQVAQQPVTICSTFLTTDERHQIWLFILRRAVERPTCNDGLRDRPRHRTSNWSRNSFPNWSWLKPTNSSQNFGIKRAGHRRLFFYVYR